MLKKSLALLLVLGMLFAFAGCQTGTAPAPAEGGEAAAETDYPKNTITIIVPWGAGGRTDTWLRALAIPMEEYLGKPVVVSNQPGGVGIVGAIAVANSKPDGYTVGPYCTAHYISTFLKDPPFDPGAYDPIAQFVDIGYVFVVPASAPYNTLTEYIEYCKAHPGEVTHGNTGAGTEDHVYASYLFKTLGIDMDQIPYSGDAAAITALLSGEIDSSMMAIAPAMPQILSGDLKAIAVSTTERTDYLPDTPTFVEQGIDFTETAWTGLFVPKGTDPAIIEKLRQAVEYSCNNDAFKDVMAGLYSPIVYMDGEEFKAKLDNALEHLKEWIDLLKAEGVDLGI